MTARHQVVLVAGPEASGVSSLVRVLRERMPEHTIAEAGDSAPDAPAAVVLVASAAAPMTESECDHAEAAVAGSDVVIGAVSRIDAHRRWRTVLAADRAELSTRFGSIPWVGVAAAPDVGDPNVVALVETLRRCLDDPTPGQRSRLQRHGFGDSPRLERIRRLRADRTALIHERRVVRSERAAMLRNGLHRERLWLGRFVRQECASLRAQHRSMAATLPRGGVGRFESALRREADAAVGALDATIAGRLGQLAATLDVAMPAAVVAAAVPDLPGRTAASRRAERGLTAALGAGFGLGVAMGLSRLMAGLAPGLSAAAIGVGGLAGLVLTVWLVVTRELLHDRALLDRWVTESVAAMRAHADDRIASALLAAEFAFSAELAARDETESADVYARIGRIDDEIRAIRRDTAGSAENRDE